MSLFVCEGCGVIENTATSRWHLGSKQCSKCDPELGKWHGYFPRTPYNGEVIVNPEAAQRFVEAGVDPDSCLHPARGSADALHPGAAMVCPDCRTVFEVHDVGRESRREEQRSLYMPGDMEWRAAA